jgi:hypothetical protein
LIVAYMFGWNTQQQGYRPDPTPSTSPHVDPAADALRVDLEWAQAQRRRDSEATLHLLEAERIAPQVIRHNVIAQEILREMLARGTKSQTKQLALLAQRAGLLQ